MLRCSLPFLLLTTACTSTPKSAPAQQPVNVASVPPARDAPAVRSQPDAPCVTPDSCPGLDWSFLGTVSQVVRQQHVLNLRPMVLGGGIAAEQPTPESRVADNHKAVVKWVGFHHEAARAGHASVVRLVLDHCIGWGSATPSSYTMHGCFTDYAVFVQPVGNTAFETRCEQCLQSQDAACRTRHCEPPVLVEGRFVGKTRAVEMDPDDPDTRRIAYEFEVFRFKSLEGEADVSSSDAVSPNRRTSVRLPAGSAMPPVEPLSKGPRFAVVHLVEPLWQPASLSVALETAQWLELSGMKYVKVVDSRLIPTLWCCGYAVIVGRYDTLAEARQVAAAYGKQGIEPIQVIDLM